MTAHTLDEAARARLMLAVVGLCWGTNWPMIKIGVSGMSPWNFRLIAFAVGAAVLIVMVKVSGRSLFQPRGVTWVHLIMSSILNVVAFGVFSALAVMTASTGRAAVVSYSFPVWAGLLAWLVLGERLSRNAIAGLLLCVAGLAVLVYPVIGQAGLIGLSLALGGAVTWAIGTIYLKYFRIPGDMLVNTTWQVIIAAAVMLPLALAFAGMPSFEWAPASSIGATIFNGVVGSAIAYLLWYHIVGHLPATTAALGSLASPVVGVLMSALILGEVPTTMDVIGFGLIFAAAMSVILQPRAPAPIAAQPRASNPESRP